MSDGIEAATSLAVKKSPKRLLLEALVEEEEEDIPGLDFKKKEKKKFDVYGLVYGDNDGADLEIEFASNGFINASMDSKEILSTAKNRFGRVFGGLEILMICGFFGVFVEFVWTN